MVCWRTPAKGCRDDFRERLRAVVVTGISLWVGMRYTGTRQRNQFLSFISLVSLLGIVLGVTVLVTVVSVMNGFDAELRQRILGVIPHGSIHARDDSLSLDNWMQLAQTIERQEGVVATAPFVESQGMLSSNGVVTVVGLFGITPEREASVSIIPSAVRAGAIEGLTEGARGIVLGQALAYHLGVEIGDPLALILPGSSRGGATVVPRIFRVTLVATYQVDSELDHMLGLMQIAELAQVLGRENQIDGIRVRVDDLYQAPKVIADLVNELGAEQYSGSDWSSRYGELFRTVEMEKTMMFLLPLLIVAIAAFNIVTGLVMLVHDKRGDIATLLTLGAQPRTIMGIFVVQGALLGLVGSVLGLMFGVLMALNVTEVVASIEQVFNIRVLGGTYFDAVPSLVDVADLVRIFLATNAITLCATLYPAYHASQLDPSEVLRYE